MEAAVTLVSYEQKSGSKAGKPWSLTIFKDQAGTEYKTFEPSIASQAIGLLNQPARVFFSQKERNGFIDNTLTDLAPAGANGATSPPAAQAPAPAPPAPKQNWELKDQRIARAHGTNAALKALEIAWNITDAGAMGNPQEHAEALLKAAVELAHIPAAYSFAGPAKKPEQPEPADEPTI